MTTERRHLVADCRRIADVLARVGDKWTILVLMAIGERRMRFGELHRAIDGISQRMLTVTLRNLERDGILTRTVYPTIPPRVEYELSDCGRSFKLALAPIRKWVMENRSISKRRASESASTSPADMAVAPD
jgi:DNA-binding HxlR family transcriptional regulator